jgi:flagellar assembly factor FliW
LDEPGLAFVIIDPALFHANYRVTPVKEALAEVEGETAEDMTVAVILTIPSNDPGGITANLRGPLLMNPRTRLCKQLVLSEDVPTRYPLFPVPSTQIPQASQPLLPTAACSA